jgi:restriction system protein
MPEISDFLLRYLPCWPAAPDGVETVGIIAGAGIAMGLLACLFPGYRSRRRSRIARHHKRTQAAASRALYTLDRIEHAGQKLSYLRTLRPFVFEELLLDAYARRGHSIRRNRRYTGDGGVDGTVLIDGQLFLIQAKRYRGHIDPSHVREFIDIVRQRRCRGVFCHTGRTGPAARRIIGGAPEILLLSGTTLLRFLAPVAPSKSLTTAASGPKTSGAAYD